MASEFVKELGTDSFTFTPYDSPEGLNEKFVSWLENAGDDALHLICIHNIDKIAEMEIANGLMMLRPVPYGKCFRR